MNVASRVVAHLLLPLVAAGPLPASEPSANGAGLRTGSAPGTGRSVAVGDAGGVWPLVPPRVAQDFAPPATRYGAGHRGVDLTGKAGQTVRTARRGRVTYAGMLAGRGVVVVDHGQRRTTYEPVDATVRPGTVVEAGAMIGTLQRAGSHCFPRVCLHWGLLHGEAYLDPLALVDAGPPRLLPWRDPMSP